jgi:antitoxin (DNA-binding transcriptional repressor) of toxin-antitoxin stability system
MTQITLSEAQQNLPELIADLQPGEEVQICQDNQPIARLIIEPRKIRLSLLQTQELEIAYREAVKESNIADRDCAIADGLSNSVAP